MVMLLPIRDQNAAPQQLGDRVGVAPFDFIPLRDQYLADKLRSGGDEWMKGWQGNLKETPNARIKNLERAKRRAFAQHGKEGKPPGFGVNGFCKFHYRLLTFNQIEGRAASFSQALKEARRVKTS